MVARVPNPAQQGGERAASALGRDWMRSSATNCVLTGDLPVWGPVAVEAAPWGKTNATATGAAMQRSRCFTLVFPIVNVALSELARRSLRPCHKTSW
ncbi:MAG: hypothetical protein DHS20C21_01040 [Gemmatimonadota bacterium]|nr:MAG: hypothetical protein DHS20C21_01040 [Gemmatimonadota bacterium]